MEENLKSVKKDTDMNISIFRNTLIQQETNLTNLVKSMFDSMRNETKHHLANQEDRVNKVMHINNTKSIEIEENIKILKEEKLQMDRIKEDFWAQTRREREKLEDVVKQYSVKHEELEQKLEFISLKLKEAYDFTKDVRYKKNLDDIDKVVKKTLLRPRKSLSMKDEQIEFQQERLRNIAKKQNEIVEVSEHERSELESEKALRPDSSKSEKNAVQFENQELGETKKEIKKVKSKATSSKLEIKVKDRPESIILTDSVEGQKNVGTTVDDEKRSISVKKADLNILGRKANNPIKTATPFTPNESVYVKMKFNIINGSSLFFPEDQKLRASKKRVETEQGNGSSKEKIERRSNRFNTSKETFNYKANATVSSMKANLDRKWRDRAYI